MAVRRELPDSNAPTYRRFWADVGGTFPDLGDAASTAVYRQSEQRIFDRHLLRPGARLLKTDLWDEAKNTRILTWAAGRGARCFGLDISPPIVRKARAGFRAGERALGGVVADVRAIPFADSSFDGVYSMGTIEHFAETDLAVREIARVLRPGGRAVVGVPNRHDPFLRPLLVVLLRALGLYAYGFEKSYSHRALRRLCEDAGLTVVAETGLLFMPGWLRMLDLAVNAWWPALSRLTGIAVRPFAWLESRWELCRRHGYLIAAVAEHRPVGGMPAVVVDEPEDH
jgi:SAM-dependent methyltransferase